MKRKYMNTDNAQWKEPELKTLISEMGGSTNMQARVIQYKAQSKACVDPECWNRRCRHMIYKCFCTKTFPRKHVLVLVDLSTLGIPQTDLI